MTDKLAYCVFCDDVRVEKDDKLSFIGTYSDKHSVDSFPVQIKSLTVVFRVDLKVKSDSNPFENVTFHIQRSDGKKYERAYTFDRIISDLKAERSEIPNNTNLVLMHAFDLEDMNFNEEGVIETFVHFDEHIHQCQSLNIVTR